MDIIRNLRRGAVRLHVLHHAAQGAVAGAWLSDELARHGYQISPGTLYPLLHDLEEQGLLSSVHQTENGRVVRLYEATRDGETVLIEARHALQELADELLPAPGEATTDRNGQ